MRRPLILSSLLILGLFAPVHNIQAQLLDILTAPKTLIDRAIEARSARNIFEDNKIVTKVNKIMVDLGTARASTEIYEQRLLMTGLFNNQKLYDKFYAEVKKIKGIKRLYWHVNYMPKAEQERREKNKELLQWEDALNLDVKVAVSLISTRGVSDVNFRVAVDAFSNVYLMGRARSAPELRKALKVARETKGVKRLINYAIVRP
jgi:hyperosmotically inducible protein